ncbi:MAG: LysE family translocator [Rhizobiaceae bacterium]
MTTELVSYLPFLFAGYFAMSLGLVSPGPNILAIVGTSMSASRRAGVMMACGVSTGSIIWATLAVGGVTALMAAYAPIAFALKVAGGLYFIWLGIKYVKAGVKKTDSFQMTESGTSSDLQYFGRGLLIQMTNPKAILSWVAMISIVSNPGAPIWVLGLYILGCSILAFAGHITWAVLFSTNAALRGYDRFKRQINATLGAIFGFIGASLLVNAFKTGTKSA